MSRRVGLFGGSFNPPHLAHLIVAETVRERCGLERVVWMPNAQPPHKDGHRLLRAEHRVAMTRLATKGNPGFVVSDLELQRDGPSYTVDTLRLLNEAQSETTFHLIIGGDSFRSFDTWHEPDEIVRRASLLVYPRPGVDLSDVEPRFMPRTQMVDAPLLEVSATDLRSRLREGRTVRYLVPEAVQAYIDEHGLYR